MCSAVRCQSCAPQAWGTPHSRAYTYIVLHQNTHTHTKGHPHRGMHDHVRAHYLLPCSPTHPRRLPQDQGGCAQGRGKRSGLPFPLGPSPTIPTSIKIWSGLQGPHQPTSSKTPSYHMPNPPPSQHSPPYHPSGFLNGTASRPGVT